MPTGAVETRNRRDQGASGPNQLPLIRAVSTLADITRFLSDYESGGRAFESLRVRHYFQTLRQVPPSGVEIWLRRKLIHPFSTRFYAQLDNFVHRSAPFPDIAIGR